jgi:NADPH:quinone reductase-like Zn-dependent oxidoreductase
LNFVRKMGFLIPIALMMRSKSILGVNLLKIADQKPYIISHCLQEVLQLYKSGKLVPQVSRNYNVSEIGEAHEALESGKTVGKLVVNWSL